MKQKHTWLATSIFCSMNHWDLVLNEISLFLHNKHFEEPDSFFFQLNYQRGDNIRWALFIPADQADYFTQQIDDHFKYFFSKTILPVKDNFSPFPQNTIRYGLYTPVYSDGTGTMEGYGIRSSLSWLTIEALAGGGIDDETIITFTFQLHIALIKLMLTRGFASITELRQVHNYSSIFRSYAIPIKEIEDNHDLIFEIAKTIIDPDESDDVPVWLQKWMSICDREIRKELPYPSNNKPLLHYKRLIYQLHIQLGITSKMESLLFFFLNHVFKANMLEEMHTIK